ncbi:hypothetical protein [Spiroplasma tabanidicola]|uniref:Uncharacterized protein n=1 Tax=Spiroplasma tabanidicola TaxID=324079 RepID=A0A6I6CC48_9MOLU|nr:hypothetical protein [Spiroplasma tabanidicola]QGS51828.1 hypothetical protein STABA_v1c04650 [Spiroplasma tabanidicola]
MKKLLYILNLFDITILSPISVVSCKGLGQNYKLACDILKVEKLIKEILINKNIRSLNEDESIKSF